MNDQLHDLESQQPRRKRKFRFGLLSLLVLIAIVSVGLSVFISQPYRRAAANTFLDETDTHFLRVGVEAEEVAGWQISLYGEEKLQPVSSLTILKETVSKTQGYMSKLARHSKAIPEVRSLSLKHIEIPDEVGEMLAAFEDLQELCCTRCKFKSIDVLMRLHQPKFVYLDQCENLELDDVERLRAKYPETFIVVANAGSEYTSPVIR